MEKRIFVAFASEGISENKIEVSTIYLLAELDELEYRTSTNKTDVAPFLKKNELIHSESLAQLVGKYLKLAKSKKYEIEIHFDLMSDILSLNPRIRKRPFSNIERKKFSDIFLKNS